MSVSLKFAVTIGLIVGSMALGYFARKQAWASERLAGGLMTFVAVLGYPSVGFFAIWALHLKAADIWLVVGGALHIAVMGGIGLAAAPLLTRDRGEKGLFAIASALGNTGFTMGAYVIYVLYGEVGLGLASIVQALWMSAVVLVTYPIARHYSSQPRPTGRSMAHLMIRSIFDWRSIGLPAAIVAIGLSVYQVPRPAWIDRLRVVDALMYLILPMAYFSIGLRLHVSFVAPLRKMIVALAAARFGAGAAVGLGMMYLTYLTPWPLTELRATVWMIESFVPVAVTTVAICNMFALRPREASVLFVVNTVMYLALVLPLVVWIFR